MSGVQSVERAMAILRAVGEEPGGLVDVAARTDLPTTTAARLLSTLEREGGLRRDSAGVYRIGPDIVSMAKPNAGVDVVRRARVHMAELADELGEAVALSIPAGASTTTVAQIDGPKPVRAEDWTGTVVPLHAGCVGLVTLAYWDDEHVDAYLGTELERLTDETVVDPGSIRERLARLRRGESLWTHGEYVEGISSVASVVFDERGDAIASLYAYGPSYRFPPDGRDETLSPNSVAEQVAVTARAVSTDLGWTPDAVDDRATRSTTRRGAA